MPAGPAPTIATLVKGRQLLVRSVEIDPHARGHGGGAGPHAALAVEPDPAILARAHEAEPGAEFAAELVPTQRTAAEQHGGEDAIPGPSVERLAVDGDADGRAMPP